MFRAAGGALAKAELYLNGRASSARYARGSGRVNNDGQHWAARADQDIANT